MVEGAGSLLLDQFPKEPLRFLLNAYLHSDQLVDILVILIGAHFTFIHNSRINNDKSK